MTNTTGEKVAYCLSPFVFAFPAVSSSLTPTQTEALMRETLFVTLFLLLAVLLISGTAQAQTAEITGHVTDPQGAAVANAQVVARNVATGVETTTRTTGDGVYRFPSLPPGDYEVRVHPGQGFGKAEAKVHIDLGAFKDVNFQLVTASATTTVEVNAEAALIETTKTDLSTLVNEADVAALPVTSAPLALGVTGVNGTMNDYVGLASTAPGVRFDTSGNSGDVIGPGSFNNRGNLYLVDGANITDQVVSIRDTPEASVEEVKEFQVITNNYNAEYGQAGGVILNVGTKAGTNQLHGDYHFYARGRNFSASNFFYNKGLFDDPIDNCPSNTTGVSASNPSGTLTTAEGCPRAPYFRHEQGITLGGPLIKDKTFWFVAWERLAGGSPLQLVPPTGSVATNQPDSELMLTGRLDHQITRNNRIFLRFHQQRLNLDNQLVQIPPTAAPDALTSFLVHDHIVYGTLVSSLTPYLVNEARMSWHRFFTETPTKSTLPGLEGPNFYYHAAFCCPQAGDQNRTEFADSLSWAHGTHAVKGGISLSYFPYFSLFQQVHYGLWDYNNAQAASDPTTAPGGSNNPPIAFTYAAGPGAVNAKDNIYGWYLQDTWKIRPSFTMNYGLRWDYEAGAFRGGYINRGSGCLQLNGHIPACSSDKNNFQPRLGLAWSPQFTSGPFHALFGDPNKSLVIAGAGEITQLAYLNISLDSLNFDGVTLLTGAVDPSQPCWGAVVAAAPGYPSAAALASCSTPGGLPSFGRVRPISDHLHNPETRDVHFTIQRELSKTAVLSIGYVGAFGFGQFGELDHNFPSINADPAHPGYFYLGSRPNPQFKAIRTQENSRTSAYHGLVIDLNKRMAHHAQFHGGYTFSKLISSTEDFYGPSEPGDPRDIRAERGLAYADARHAGNFAFILDSNRLFSTSVVNHLFNDWQVGLQGNLHSGQPYDVSTGEAPFSGSKFFGLGAETQQRPNVLSNGTLSVTNIPSYAGGNLNISSAGVAACLAAGQTSCPATTTFVAPAGASASGPVDSLDGSTPVDFQFLNGNVKRNSGKGDPYYRFDLSVARTIPIRERVKIELRADFFNVFNRTNFLGFNGLDALNGFSIPSLTTTDANGNTIPNPGFNSSCAGCLNPFTGQFVGSSGQILHLRDLQRGLVSPKKNLYSVFGPAGIGDPIAADIARQIQLTLHVRW
jgi:hypothetical protein